LWKIRGTLLLVSPGLEEQWATHQAVLVTVVPPRGEAVPIPFDVGEHIGHARWSMSSRRSSFDCRGSRQNKSKSRDDRRHCIDSSTVESGSMCGDSLSGCV
jgi:hypothetical protein